MSQTPDPTVTAELHAMLLARCAADLAHPGVQPATYAAQTWATCPMLGNLFDSVDRFEQWARCTARNQTAQAVGILADGVFAAQVMPALRAHVEDGDDAAINTILAEGWATHPLLRAGHASFETFAATSRHAVRHGTRRSRLRLAGNC